MNYAAIHIMDIANGLGCRTSLFVSGCTHHCPGCFNPETWDFSYGKPYTKEIEDHIIATYNPYMSGLTILGGEPMEITNQEAILSLIERTKDLGKTVWIYSGYTWEELNDPKNSRCHGSCTNKILSLIDVLVDGEFHESEKDITLKYRGSRNQRLIDVPETLKQNKLIVLDL